MKEEFEINPMNPLVSVVVITYNSEKYILDTLESIKTQTYPNLELIISDDFSKDETVNICKNWLIKNGERFLRSELLTTLKNTGTAGNLNRGIKIAHGEWIKFIAGDDALNPDLIHHYIKYIQENPDVEFLHSNVQHYREFFDEENRLPPQDAKKYKINQNGISPIAQFEILLRTTMIGTPTVMIKNTVFKKVGLFDERYPLWEDRPMFLKITRNNIKLVYLDIIGAKYRERIDSVAHAKGGEALVTNFHAMKHRCYNELFLVHLSGTEKNMKKLLSGIEIFFYKNHNNNSLPGNLIFKLLVFPLRYFINRIDKTYR